MYQALPPDDLLHGHILFLVFPTQGGADEVLSSLSEASDSGFASGDSPGVLFSSDALRRVLFPGL